MREFSKTVLNLRLLSDDSEAHVRCKPTAEGLGHLEPTVKPTGTEECHFVGHPDRAVHSQSHSWPRLAPDTALPSQANCGPAAHPCEAWVRY